MVKNIEQDADMPYIVILYIFKNKGNKKMSFNNISDSVQPYDNLFVVPKVTWESELIYTTRKRMLKI